MPSKRKTHGAGLLVAFALTGCISKYYWGASVHSDGGALVRPVARSVDDDLQPFSRQCLEGILRQDVNALRKVASGDLEVKLQDESIRDRLLSTAHKYSFTGAYEQMNSTGGGIWADEAIKRDPYKYDFLVTEFLLFGKTNAHAFLLLKKRGNDLTAVGIDIHSAAEAGEEPDISLMPVALKGWRPLGRR